jgi:hypothetical protein
MSTQTKQQTKKKAAPKTNSIGQWFDQHFSVYIYAAMKDILRTWDGEGFDDLKYESYDNIIKPTEERITVSKMFTISASMKKLATVLLTGYVDEITCLDPIQEDTPESLVGRASGMMSFLHTIDRVISAHYQFCGKTLLDASPQCGHVLGEILFGILPPEWNKYGSGFTGRLVDYYIKFMRSMAFILATQKCYTKKTLVMEDILTILITFGCNPTKVDEFRGECDIEKKTKPRDGKGKKDKKKDAAGETPSESTPPASVPAPAPTPSDPPAADPVKVDGILGDLLAKAT